MSPETHHTIVNVIDGVAAGVMVASLAGILPQIASLFTIAWTGMRIYEMVYGAPFSTSRIARWISGRL